MGRMPFLEVAREIVAAKFPAAAAVFVAGSVTRGEDTPYSDIDMIVVFDRVENAKRESFVYKDWPVEVFHHDPETMHAFWESDAGRGQPALCGMVTEGTVLGRDPQLAAKLKTRATQLLSKGPAPLTASEIDDRRYIITDLVDDLRAFRSRGEAIATGGRLFEALGDFHLRAQGRWSSAGKGLFRALKKSSAELAERFDASFAQLYAGDARSVIQLAEEVLRPYGGFLFDGYARPAPKDRRKPIDLGL